MKIPFKTVFQQLKKDLIGKDSHRGVTLTYSWLANQFGHFSLGFIPTVFLYRYLTNWYPEGRAALYAALGVALFWTLFETYNFLKPLLVLMKKSVFKPNFKNIGFDTFTDLCFFYTGALAAFFYFSSNPILFAVFIILGIVLLFFSYYWYVTKMYMQFAKFPYQLRLSQFILPISAESKKAALDFISSNNTKHTLIFGDKLSGKTSLAVSIATELSIKRASCYYTTSFKLINLMYLSDEELFQKSMDSWTWRTSSCLIIDDINAGNQIEETFSATTFFNYIQNKVHGEQNLAALKNQKVIWVIGNNKKEDEWVTALTQAGIEKSNVSVINL